MPALTASQQARARRKANRAKGLARDRAANRAQNVRDYLRAHPPAPGTIGAMLS